MSSRFSVFDFLLDAKKLLPEITGFEEVNVLIYENLEEKFTTIIQSSDKLELATYPTSVGMTGKAIQTKESQVNNGQNDFFNSDIDNLIGKLVIKNNICAPLICRKGKLNGVIQFINKRNGLITPADLTKLKHLQNGISELIENLREKLTVIDIFESLKRTTLTMKSISENTDNETINEGSLIPLEMVIMKLDKIFEAYKEKNTTKN